MVWSIYCSTCWLGRVSTDEATACIAWHLLYLRRWDMGDWNRVWRRLTGWKEKDPWNASMTVGEATKNANASVYIWVNSILLLGCFDYWKIVWYYELYELIYPFLKAPPFHCSRWWITCISLSYNDCFSWFRTQAHFANPRRHVNLILERSSIFICLLQHHLFWKRVLLSRCLSMEMRRPRREK